MPRYRVHSGYRPIIPLGLVPLLVDRKLFACCCLVVVTFESQTGFKASTPIWHVHMASPTIFGLDSWITLGVGQTSKVVP